MGCSAVFAVDEPGAALILLDGGGGADFSTGAALVADGDCVASGSREVTVHAQCGLLGVECAPVVQGAAQLAGPASAAAIRGKGELHKEMHLQAVCISAYFRAGGAIALPVPPSLPK